MKLDFSQPARNMQYNNDLPEGFDYDEEF